MYRIRFAPYPLNYKTAHPELQCCRVYSERLDEIHMFLRQHNFDVNRTFIENIPGELANEDDLDEHLLHPYFMQSNQDKQMYQIYTSRRLVDLTVHYTSESLGDHLILGECILRRDIEVIQLIIHNLETLPFTEILDFNALDGNSINDICDTSWMIVAKTIEQIVDNPSGDVTDTSGIFEMLSNEIRPDEPLPITIEAYVEAFVRIIMKKYNGALEDGEFVWSD